MWLFDSFGRCGYDTLTEINLFKCRRRWRDTDSFRVEIDRPVQFWKREALCHWKELPLHLHIKTYADYVWGIGWLALFSMYSITNREEDTLIHINIFLLQSCWFHVFMNEIGSLCLPFFNYVSELYNVFVNAFIASGWTFTDCYEHWFC